MRLKSTAKGLTQKWSVSSGSRAVMWPATPSLKPNLPNRRKAAASRCLMWVRSSSTESKVGNAYGSGFFSATGASSGGGPPGPRTANSRSPRPAVIERGFLPRTTGD